MQHGLERLCNFPRDWPLGQVISWGKSTCSLS